MDSCYFDGSDEMAECSKALVLNKCRHRSHPEVVSSCPALGRLPNHHIWSGRVPWSPFINVRDCLLLYNSPNTTGEGLILRTVRGDHFYSRQHFQARLFLLFSRITAQRNVIIIENALHKQSLENVVCYRKDNPAGPQFQSSPSWWVCWRLHFPGTRQYEGVFCFLLELV